MATEYTESQLNNMSKDEMKIVILSLQTQLNTLNTNMEILIEQLRIANQQRFGRHTETLSSIDGQIGFFNDVEAVYDENAEEPSIDEVTERKKKKKVKGQRNINLAGFEEKEILHTLDNNKLDAFFGEGNWRRLPSEVYKRLACIPTQWIVEVHNVDVVVGTDGDHQDEFVRGDRPKDLLRNSILTPSLAAALINAKYVNSMPLDRMEKEFDRNEINISKQTMSNWLMLLSEKYFTAVCERIKSELLAYHVNQSDETPVQVLHKDGKPGGKSYMWVHRSGEFYRDKQIVLFEYQPGRAHKFPLEFYKDYKGILVTDGLSQYHLVDKKLDGVDNSNCWVHARRFFADAVKAASRGDPASAKRSIAYQALLRISSIYKIEESLKDLTPDERLRVRIKSIKPLVDEYFTWIKEQASQALPKGKTAEGITYCINQEQYLRVFLKDGEVPVDNSASERALRTFCIGRNNWKFCNTERGAQASANIYSISETAKLNNLKPLKYFEYILTQLPYRCDADGNIDPNQLDDLMPWSDKIPEDCKKIRR